MTSTQAHPVHAVGTCTLLSAIADTSRDRDLLPGVPLAVLAAGVTREIGNGNLTEGLNLTAHGTATLGRLRGKDLPRGALQVARHHDCTGDLGACWTIRCTTCVSLIGEHISDPHLIDAIFDVCLNHDCAGPFEDNAQLREQPTQMR